MIFSEVNEVNFYQVCKDEDLSVYPTQILASVDHPTHIILHFAEIKFYLMLEKNDISMCIINGLMILDLKAIIYCLF